MGDPDGRLVIRARAGDHGAFAELVQRHSAVVHRVAARVVGPEDADDVAQGAFLRAFHRLERFRGEGDFRAWLLQITHNAALTAIARRRPEPVGGPDEVPEADTEVAPARRREPVAALESSERRERIEGKLRGMRDEHRVVLVLRDVEGLGYAEIAAITQTPLGSVKGRLHRARGELIDMLRANTYDWDLPE